MQELNTVFRKKSAINTRARVQVLIRFNIHIICIIAIQCTHLYVYEYVVTCAVCVSPYLFISNRVHGQQQGDRKSVTRKHSCTGEEQKNYPCSQKNVITHYCRNICLDKFDCVITRY